MCAPLCLPAASRSILGKAGGEKPEQERFVQPVLEKMRLEMLAESQLEILDNQTSYLFSNEPFEKRPGMTIEDFGLGEVCTVLVFHLHVDLAYFKGKGLFLHNFFRPFDFVRKIVCFLINKSMIFHEFTRNVT